MTKTEVDDIKRHFDVALGGLRSEMGELGAGLRAEMTQQMTTQGMALRSEIADLGASLRSEMTEQMTRQGGNLRSEIADLGTSLRSEIAEVRRHAGVVADDLRSDIRQVAEGVSLANERIDGLDNRVDSLTGEMRRGFAGVRAEIRRLHETDDRLAEADDALRARIERLESGRPA